MGAAFCAFGLLVGCYSVLLTGWLAVRVEPRHAVAAVWRAVGSGSRGGSAAQAAGLGEESYELAAVWTDGARTALCDGAVLRTALRDYPRYAAEYAAAAGLPRPLVVPPQAVQGMGSDGGGKVGVEYTLEERAVGPEAFPLTPDVVPCTRFLTRPAGASRNVEPTQLGRGVSHMVARAGRALAHGVWERILGAVQPGDIVGGEDGDDDNGDDDEAGGDANDVRGVIEDAGVAACPHCWSALSDGAYLALWFVWWFWLSCSLSYTPVHCRRANVGGAADGKRRHTGRRCQWVICTSAAVMPRGPRALPGGARC